MACAAWKGVGRVSRFVWHSGSCLGQGPAGVGFTEAGTGCSHRPPRASQQALCAPRAADFHVSGSASLGARHFLVTELPRRLISILQGNEAGVAAVL